MSKDNNISDLVGVCTAATILGVRRQTIHNRLKAGTAPPHEVVDGRVMFHKAALKSYTPPKMGRKPHGND